MQQSQHQKSYSKNAKACLSQLIWHSWASISRNPCKSFRIGCIIELIELKEFFLIWANILYNSGIRFATLREKHPHAQLLHATTLALNLLHVPRVYSWEDLRTKYAAASMGIGDLDTDVVQTAMMGTCSSGKVHLIINENHFQFSFPNKIT